MAVRRTIHAKEADLHRAAVDLLDLLARRYGFVWTTVPGGNGRVTTAPGYRAGWPDLLLIWPRAVASMIELKRERGGRVDPKQAECHAALRARCCTVTVARSLEEIAAHVREVAAIVERDEDLGVAPPSLAAEGAAEQSDALDEHADMPPIHGIRGDVEVVG